MWANTSLMSSSFSVDTVAFTSPRAAKSRDPAGRAACRDRNPERDLDLTRAGRRHQNLIDERLARLAVDGGLHPFRLTTSLGRGRFSAVPSE
jgi:hypothetical protein